MNEYVLFQLSAACVCSASGDPHFRTFDGQLIHYMGTCTNTLTKSIIPDDPCKFNIEVKLGEPTWQNQSFVCQQCACPNTRLQHLFTEEKESNGRVFLENEF